MDKLSPQQVAFFDTFGYIHLLGLMSEDIDWIVDEFGKVFTDRAIEHDPSRRTTVVPFIDSREKLCTLLDHPKLEGAIASLIGDDFNYMAGDGNYYSGDTSWHPDGAHRIGKYIKAAFYLDPVGRDTGCLRVIPGTRRLDCEPAWEALKAPKSRELWGVEGREVPCVALESQPGDVVIFNHNLLHASYGGGHSRRMFTLNCGRHATSPEEVESLRQYIRYHNKPHGERVHGERMRATARPDRMRHLTQPIEYEMSV